MTGALGLLLARFVPLAKLPFWGCGFRKLTGLPCPGCGLTRAAEHLAYGRFGAAWEANPLGATVGGLFALAAVLAFIHLAFRAPVPRVLLSEREARVARVSAIALVVVNYAAMLLRARFLGAG